MMLWLLHVIKIESRGTSGCDLKSDTVLYDVILSVQGQGLFIKSL